MNQNTRIGLDDTLMSSMVKLSEGNPGALNVLLQLSSQNAEIDPHDFAGALGSILSLDSHAIYGPRIWMLFKDVCGENITKVVVCLRAVQLGFISEEKLAHAIDNRGAGIDVNELHNKVCAQLDNFKKPN